MNADSLGVQRAGTPTKSPQPRGGLRTGVLLRRGRRVAQWRSALRERLASASSLSWSMWAWATMTSMVENMSDLLVGSYSWVVSLSDEAGDRPADLERGACRRGSRRRDPACFKQEKRPTSLAAVSGA